MWTSEQDAELLSRWPDESASEIAQALGCTRNAVIGRYHRLVGTYVDYDQRRAAAGIAMRTAARTARLASRRDVAGKALDLSKDRDEAIAAAVAKGALQTDVAEIIGVTPQRISQIVRLSETRIRSN